jgi:phage major head subunit gpT-like protein
MLSALGSRAIIGEFYNRLSQEEGIPWVNGISMFFESDQASEIYEQIGQVPTMQEWVSGRNAKMLELLGKITIINKHYESTLQVLKSEIRRDKTGQVQVRLNDQVRRAQAHWALLLTDLIKTGQTVAGQDGQFFFDTDHTEGNNTTNQDNDLTTNITVAASPTAVEMETAIFNMIATIIGFLDNESQPMNEDATAFTVMVRQNMMAAATAAIQATTITDSSGSKTNVLATLGNFTIDLAVNPRLTATDEFYVFRTDGNGTKAFIRQEETPLTIEALAEGSDEAFKNKRHLYGIDTWRNVDFGMWQHACLQTFT